MNDNQLIKISNPLEPFNRECLPVPYEPGRSIKDLIALSGFGESVIVLKNGEVIDNYDAILLPGDVIHVYPRLHNDTVKTIGMIGLSVLAAYVIGPAVAGWAGGGFFGAAAGGLATVATITVGGMILNSGLSASSPSAKSLEESPTYHWDLSTNPAREGLAIPVIYGEVYSYPTIINQWIEIISGEQWAHTVLCVGEGLTNNVPTADDIYAGDQQLSLYADADYTLVTTDGGASPVWGGATDFTTPHQMRKIDRQMEHAVVSSVLLHLNGTNGSTTITESSQESNVWTCQNTAALSTTTPKYGTACLDIETSGDYVSCNTAQSASFDIWTTDFMCLECFWQQDTLTNSAIMGQSRVVAAGDEYYWGLFYDHDNTSLVFQQYKVTSAGVYTIYYNVARNIALVANTWYHLCVQKWGSNQVRLYQNGTLLGAAASATTTPVDPPAGTWGQALGGARFYSTGPEADTQWWGECRLDEVRIIIEGIAYNPLGFTAPAAEVTDTASEEYYYTTKGHIDKFTVILTAPFGVYWLEDDGSLSNYYIPFHISYRAVGDSAWTTSYELFYGATRNPYRESYDYTMPARGEYEIKVRRSAIDDTDTKAQTRTMLSYIDEYLDMTLTYPYLQCVGISLRAQDEFNGTIPAFKVKSNRSSIVVPNYSEVGTQTVNPTTNPYAALDMLTNDIYGAGLSATRIVEADWEAWVTWCTTTVATYQRAQTNIIFDAVSTIDDALQQIENCGRAKIVRRGSQLSCNIDKPSSAVALFGYGNVVQESDHVKWVRQAERPDAVEVSYRDIDLDYSENTASAYSSGYHALTRVPRVVRLNIPGINNSEQAKREAILRQQINDSIKRELELESGLEAIPVVSGDVINYQASINAFTGRLPRYSDRTEEWTGTTVYLDQEINLPSATYSGNCILMVRDPDDTIQTYTVTGPFDSDEWYVTVSASGTFNYLAPYIICRNTGDVYQYKVVDMKRSNELDIKIQALQYDSTAYYHADYESGGVAI